MSGFKNEVMFAEQGADVGVFPNTSSSDSSTEFSRSGGDVVAIVNNTSDTANSTASNVVRVEGTSAGDAWYQISIGSTKSYAIGQDQDDTFLAITTDNSGSVDPSSGQTLLTFDEAIVGAFRARFPIPNMALDSNVPGGEVDFNLQNLDNTLTTSGCRVDIEVGGDSGGDPYVTYTGGTWGSWSTGVANAVNDVFRIFRGNTPSTTSIIAQQITTAGAVTFPLTPAFLAKRTTDVFDVTGDGTIYIVVYEQEIFDQNLDFDGVSTFTAPVTGRYSFNFAVAMFNLGNANTAGNTRITTSNRNYETNEAEYRAIRNPANFLSMSMSILSDMDAGDTATTGLLVSGGTLIVDVAGQPGNTITYFSGKLEA